jgi:RNA polymerase sigma-70 factor (ECF subfamily)
MDTTPFTLLQRLRRPDQPDAWGRFVELYTPLLLQWARQLGERGEDAADLVQEVFVVLFQKLPTFDYDTHKSFRGWLRTIAVNKWRDSKRRKKLPLEPGSSLSGVTVPDDVPEFWERDYQQYLVRRALEVMRNEFQPTTREACWKLVVDGRPAAEVARELGISENAVYVAKYKVIRRVRRELEGLLGEGFGHKNGQHPGQIPP